MLREALQSTVEAAVAALVREGRLPAAVADVPVEISDTRSPDHGDYACNLAMVAAKKAGVNPRALGEMFREALLSGDGSSWSRGEEATASNQPPTRAEGGTVGEGVLADVDVAGPGFLNLKLRPEAIAAYVPGIVAQGEAFGRVKQTNPQRINVEFVSVNPNGPITIGSGRGAAFGSALCNVLQAAGNVVHREYYINDGVNSEQMRQFAESVRAIALGRPLPENAYRGEYVHDVAKQVVSALHEPELRTRMLAYMSGEYAYKMPRDASKASSQRLVLMYEKLLNLVGRTSNVTEIIEHISTEQLQRLCEFEMVTRQGNDLAHFGVVFDTWFSEQSLHDQGIVAERIERLKTTGVADEEPYRTKLKLGRGGAVEETIREDQPNEDEGSEDEQPTLEQPTPTLPSPKGEGSGTTLWLRSTKFGDDMDRVLRRRDGRLTYIASDIAYHENKLTRPEGATRLITILGPDHHGYIGRLTAVMAALLRGADDSPEADQRALAQAKETLEVVIYQLVRFLKDGKPAPMRKRDGNIYELRDLIDELGKSLNPDGTSDERRTTGRDVARFFYLMRSHDTTMDFDIDLATQQSDENPVFYAQYAHARICSVLRKASVPLSFFRGDEAPNSDRPDREENERGVGGRASETPSPATSHAGEGAGGRGYDTSLLTDPRELALVKKILDLPWEVGRIAQDYGVHRLATYAVELARTYHHFYDACRVIQPDEPDLTRARLALCEATRVALRATFALLGVSAPERLDRRSETPLHSGGEGQG